MNILLLFDVSPYNKLSVTGLQNSEEEIELPLLVREGRL